MSTTPRQPFIAWMKAIGMMLIVYGHVGAWLPLVTLPPILTKQLGVAFFVFISAMTLATDRRPASVIVVRRLFEILVFAAIVAAVVSVVGMLTDGNPQESNYLPFFFGVNVFFDFFPANPTTWYVGTYMHLVALALVLRRWRPTWPQVALLAAGEIALRGVLLWYGFVFIPYQLLTNWVIVYCLGRMWADGDARVRHWTTAVLVVAAATAASLSLPPVTRYLPFYLPPSNELSYQLVISAAVTFLYAGTTLAMAQLGSAFATRTPAAIRVVADHTPMIFIAHMPIYYALGPVTMAYFGAWRAPILFFACILVSIVASTLLRRSKLIGMLRERAGAVVGERAPRAALA